MVMQMEATGILEEFIANRSPELREKLVLQSVPLVHYLLGRMGVTRERGSDYEDLAHQGLIGLIEAVDHFDPKFNTKFSTYASLRIRGKIMDYLRTTDWMPRAARKRSRLIQKSITTLWSENFREPTEDEIASYLGTNVEDVQQGLADTNRVLVSLDMMMEGDHEGEVPLHEKYGDEKQANPLDLLEEKDMAEDMAEAIKSLDEREQLVLSLYYNEELTFKEIGKVLDITESRVCQLHARALVSLKAMMES
ncbi:MAG TPA: FliA/WhiG family RNA polymerase sigma factor [Anaerolineales bacterium]|nr:FliA/WhiG family RNA polymerase sigma factor [Anaerolineales bacterium]HMZ05987.1 FliA/WhiG family RNA polymerase sigma factor [Anaerolineales bacterium]HNA87833.1 FliA/WhiG family RNA polymerase sigma factor [Anaerolineales bacterium]HNC88381.1 FliA/WhiG family RNA polymerase sigma factor [Anaerolineales bacterium]HND91537.1 FliA/WhiG family RNA polymerase sigma factor [Anaerolineales bacterium]